MENMENMENNTKIKSLAQLFDEWGMHHVLPKSPKMEKKEGFESLSPTGIHAAYDDPMNRFAIGDDKISQFFIGSFTVVGLFVLYRFMNKK
jgi:hypothetical protein